MRRLASPAANQIGDDRLSFVDGRRQRGQCGTVAAAHGGLVILGRSGHARRADGAGRTFQRMSEIGAIEVGRRALLRQSLHRQRRLFAKQAEQFRFERLIAHRLARQVHKVDSRAGFDLRFGRRRVDIVFGGHHRHIAPRFGRDARPKSC